jgi:hypothetical protein
VWVTDPASRAVGARGRHEQYYDPQPQPDDNGVVDTQELAAFLRSRRQRLQPEDVGLPAGARRRTPGLRREEVAVLAHISTEANNVVQLEPITSNLAYPSENWVRLEVALLFNGPPDVKVSEDIHQDILAYIRTVSLQQIEGPRGFQYLKDDIQERVDLRSQGRVSKVMFRTFVIE